MRLRVDYEIFHRRGAEVAKGRKGSRSRVNENLSFSVLREF